MKKSSIIGITALLLAIIVCISISGCASRFQAADLTKDIVPSKVTGKTSDARFSNAQIKFALDLFAGTFMEKQGENILISPLSVTAALAMTANGADGTTKQQFEAVLGSGIETDELNKYLYSFLQSLSNEEKGKLKIANSIWFKTTDNSFTADKDFLQKNADWFSASIYGSDFDSQTVKDINAWVSEKTDKMIDRVVDEISDDTVMFLVNALAFDAEWQDIYTKENISDGEFTSLGGQKRTVGMMHSYEHKYLDDGNATGFVKDYAGGRYSFVALLPNEGVSLSDYVETLANTPPEKLVTFLSSPKNATVEATMPKFGYDFEIKLNDTLASLGLSDAFDSSKADLSKLGNCSDGNNLYINEVLHKTHIEVGERGTKAGAVTSVEVNTEASMYPEEIKEVTLDRPFVYIIFDNETSTPIFIGSVTDIQK